MNLLQLTQATAFKSRTVPGLNQPPTIDGLTGRQARCLDAVKQAWTDIQTSRPNWNWMRRDFTGAVLSGIATYEPSDFIPNRFRSWRIATRSGLDSGWSIYKTSEGAADERPLLFVPWESFRETYMRGAPAADYPTYFTEDPRHFIRVAPTPDADYTIRGEYQRGVQRITLATESPEVDDEWHDLVWLKAILILNEGDESAYVEPRTRARITELTQALERHELPKIAIGGFRLGGGTLA